VLIKLKNVIGQLTAPKPDKIAIKNVPILAKILYKYELLMKSICNFGLYIFVIISTIWERDKSNNLYDYF
jgi:hypothetical protein